MANSNKDSIIAIALITAICLAGDSMLYIVLPTHWKEVGLTSLIQVGVLLSVNRFVRLPLNPLIGFLFKKVSFRKGILLAVVLSGITTISYSLVKDFSLWLILRSVWGVSWSIFKLGAYLLVLQFSTDSNRGNMMGTYNGLYRLGSLFGMLLGGIFADLFGIKVISIVLGSLAFISIPFIFKYIPNRIQTDKGEERNNNSSLINIKGIQNKRLISILITAFLLILILDGMLTATLSHIIEMKFTNKIDIIGVMIGAATLAGVMQSLRWVILPFVIPKIGNVLDKAKQKSNILIMFLGCASVLLVLIALPLGLTSWLIVLLIHLLIASIITTIIDAIITDFASKVSNTVFIMTLFTIIIDLGAALGPITGYILEHKIGMTNLFLAAASVCLILKITWIFPSRYMERAMIPAQNKQEKKSSIF